MLYKFLGKEAFN